MKYGRFLVLFLLGLFLSGCKLVVLEPSGDVARQQADLIIYATVLMLIVIVPVIALTIFFAIRFRHSNEEASYEPEWSHSISLEIVIWSVPLAIIICLAGLTWVATHRLNPYDPLQRISEDEPVNPDVKPLIIEVAAMDWKWLFLYPEQGIATVNEVAAPVNQPIEFRLSSTTVMNSFFVPALSGQIYAMAGMQTELNAVINEPGVYRGFSSNYSGAGFSWMRFKFHGLEQDGFDAWVDQVRADTKVLDQKTLAQLNQASIDHPVTYYGTLEDGLWERIVNTCVGETDLCRHDMMMVDALGGGGLEGLWNREMFRGICSSDDPAAFMALLKPEMRYLETDIVSELALLPSNETRRN